MQRHLLLVAATVLLPLLCGCSSSSTITVEVVNRATQVVKSVDARLRDERAAVTDLEPGRTHTISFAPVEDGYHIRVEYGDGTVRQLENVGYVTPGMDSHDAVVIFNDRVEFRSLDSDNPVSAVDVER